jgi:uncharacterized protein (DUF1501 family)
MKINRRNFLKGALTTLFLTGLNLPAISQSNNKKNLIIITLRGGMDGMLAIPSLGDKNFESLRPNLIFDNHFKLNSDFSLHSKLSEFYELWKIEKSSFVHATSTFHKDGQHWEAQNLMENGGLFPFKESTGWLGRAMELKGLDTNMLYRNSDMPLLLRGKHVKDFYYPTIDYYPNRNVFKQLTASYKDNNEIELNEILKIIDNREKYPFRSKFSPFKSRFTLQNHEDYLKNFNDHTLHLAKKAALLMKEKEGPRVAVFEIEGFDAHRSYEKHWHSTDGLSKINTIVKELRKGLKKEFDNTLILTMTEFGRTVKENEESGTDHGWASAILMAGGLIKKSQVLSDWPGLSSKDLYADTKLKSTINSRSIYASAISNVFDLDFDIIRKKIFWDKDLVDYSSKLFI